jgi:hypothetical protein
VRDYTHSGGRSGTVVGVEMEGRDVDEAGDGVGEAR